MLTVVIVAWVQCSGTTKLRIYARLRPFPVYGSRYDYAEERVYLARLRDMYAYVYRRRYL